jgi:hypothetical protein
MASSGKFGIKKLQKSSGSLGVFDIIDDSQIRIIVENAGVTNIVAVYGKIQGQNSYQLLDTVVGSTNKLIDVSLYDFLDLEVVTYDSNSNYIDIAGSGFSNVTVSGGGGGPASSVTVTNFPNPQNVVVTNAPHVIVDNLPVGVTKSVFNEVLAVASGVTTVLITYTVPAGKTAVLEKAFASGDNIGQYNVFVNGVRIDSMKTYFGGALNVNFDFSSGYSGYALATGDVVVVKVLHTRPTPGDFTARIQISEN